MAFPPPINTTKGHSFTQERLLTVFDPPFPAPSSRGRKQVFKYPFVHLYFDPFGLFCRKGSTFHKKDGLFAVGE
jgi:hypothetical protein